MTSANQIIRNAAKEARLPLWKLAEALGVTDSTLSRRLRHEFTPQETARSLALIRQMAQKGVVSE